MARTRLNNNHRELLSSFAEENLVIEPETAEMLAKYEIAANLIREIVLKKYPAKHMDILAKYKMTCVEDDFKGTNLDTRQTVAFKFTENFPRFPDQYSHKHTNFAIDQETAEAIDNYNLSKAKFDEKKKEKLAMYRGLIYGSKSFEDVTEIWTAAEVLRPRICTESNAVTVLSEELRNKIKADNAGASA